MAIHDLEEVSEPIAATEDNNESDGEIEFLS